MRAVVSIDASDSVSVGGVRHCFVMFSGVGESLCVGVVLDRASSAHLESGTGRFNSTPQLAGST